MPKLSLLTAALTFTDTLSAPAWTPRPFPLGSTFRELRQNLENRAEAREAARLERTWHERLRSGRPLTLGHLEAPLDAGTISSLLHRLTSAPAGAIHLVCQNEPSSNDLSLYREIDQHHALQVDLLMASEELAPSNPNVTGPNSASQRSPWQWLRELTDTAIATRVGIPFLPGISDQEFHLHSLFEAALAHGAFDLFPVIASDDKRRRVRESWMVAFRRLRLEYACPRAIAGRA